MVADVEVHKVALKWQYTFLDSSIFRLFLWELCQYGVAGTHLTENRMLNSALLDNRQQQIYSYFIITCEQSYIYQRLLMYCVNHHHFDPNGHSYGFLQQIILLCCNVPGLLHWRV
jgi:hypothetical protein